MMEIVFVRHGETDSNKRSAYLGWTDVVLNEKGLQQACEVREKLAGQRFTAFYTSPLKRARKTAFIINESLNMKIDFSKDIMERNFGIFEDLNYNEIREKYPKQFRSWINDQENYVIEGGESQYQTHKRITGFIDRLVAENSSGSFLIVSHLGSIREMLAHLLGMGMMGAWRFYIENCGIVRIKINDEKYAYLTLLNG